MLSLPARPIRTHHLDDLELLVTKRVSGFTHFVIFNGFRVKRLNVKLIYSSEVRALQGGNFGLVHALLNGAMDSATLTFFVVGQCGLTLSNPR